MGYKIRLKKKERLAKREAEAEQRYEASKEAFIVDNINTSLKDRKTDKELIKKRKKMVRLKKRRDKASYKSWKHKSKRIKKGDAKRERDEAR